MAELGRASAIKVCRAWGGEVAGRNDVSADRGKGALSTRDFGPRAWPVGSTDAMFGGVMVGMLLVVALIFGLYLPKLTESWATLVVPLAAALGLVFLARRSKPRVAFEAGSLVLIRGNRRRQLRLASIRFGYARLRTPPPGGLAGTVLVVQDGETQLAISGSRFLFDVSARYQINETDYAEFYLESEADFQEFITHFEEQVLAHDPRRPTPVVSGK